jgi:hypothetical protein
MSASITFPASDLFRRSLQQRSGYADTLCERARGIPVFGCTQRYQQRNAMQEILFTCQFHFRHVIGNIQNICEKQRQEFLVEFSHHATQSFQASNEKRKKRKIGALLIHMAGEYHIITFIFENNDLFHKNCSVRRNNDRMKAQ